MLVWQNADKNEWFTSIQRSLAGSATGPALPREVPDPFSLANPAIVEAILDATSFAHATFADVHEPVYYGQDVATSAPVSIPTR